MGSREQWGLNLWTSAPRWWCIVITIAGGLAIAFQLSMVNSFLELIIDDAELSSTSEMRSLVGCMRGAAGPSSGDVLSGRNESALWNPARRAGLESGIVVLGVIMDEPGSATLHMMPAKLRTWLFDAASVIDEVHVWTGYSQDTHWSVEPIFDNNHPPPVHVLHAIMQAQEDVLALYRPVLRRDDVVILVRPSVAFMDPRRLFDFVERVRSGPSASATGRVGAWLANSMGNPWQVKEGLFPAEIDTSEIQSRKSGYDVLMKRASSIMAYKNQVTRVAALADLGTDETVLIAFSGAQVGDLSYTACRLSLERRKRLRTSAFWHDVLNELLEDGNQVMRDLGFVASHVRGPAEAAAAPVSIQGLRARLAPVKKSISVCLTTLRLTSSSGPCSVGASEVAKEVHIWPLDGASGLLSPRPGSDDRPLNLWTNFAGREEVFGLQVNYIKQLLEAGTIDEVHIWDITCKTKEKARRGEDPRSLAWIDDRRWLRSLAAEDGRFQIAVPTSCGWGAYYEFYGDEKLALKPDDVLIKVDDDVVFFEVAHVPGFLDTIRRQREIFLWSAAVFNNDVAGRHLVQHGMIPADLGPPQWADADKIVRLHHYLIANYRSQLEPLSTAKKDVVENFKTRLSINFVAWCGEMIRTASKIVLSNLPDDEHALTIVAQRHGYKEALYMGLIAAHATFYSQTSKAPEIAAAYREAQRTCQLP